MTSSDLWDAGTAQRYDDDHAAMFVPAVLDPTIERLEALAAGGEGVEFAIGTGRIALPLAARGLTVRGIELSEPMVERLRAKPGGDALEVTIGDLATATVGEPGTASLVVLVFNTLSNLRRQDEQVAAFANAARHLRPGGRFVVEMWLPALQRLSGGLVVESHGPGHHVVDEIDVVTQSVVSHHYRTEPDAGTGSDADGTARYGSGRFRYVWPSEMDLMARLAGMGLESRHADWRGTPVSAAATHTVSVWRLDPDAPGGAADAAGA